MGAAEQSGRGIDRETWRQLLGDRVAQRSEPERLQGKTLTVVVASSVWAQELSLLAPEIIERLQKAQFEVETLRWRVGTPKFAASPVAAVPRVLPLKQLPNDLSMALKNVADLELRAAISEAAAHVLGRQETARRRATNEAPPDVRAPQCAEPKTSRQDPNEPGRHAAWQRTRAKRSD